jgi:hypothetical protein
VNTREELSSVRNTGGYTRSVFAGKEFDSLKVKCGAVTWLVVLIVTADGSLKEKCGAVTVAGWLGSYCRWPSSRV